jgi:hypothetical protein
MIQLDVAPARSVGGWTPREGAGEAETVGCEVSVVGHVECKDA